MSKPVYFITNRTVSKKKNGRITFGDDCNGNPEIRCGVYRSSKDIVLYPDVESRGSIMLFKELQEELKGSDKDIVIYIHGFNVDFEEAIENAMGILRDSDRFLPIIWSWPSDGRLSRYKEDRKDARCSRMALSRSLEKLQRFLIKTRNSWCDRKIHLITESMGAYMFRHGLQEHLHSGKPMRLFEQVLLIAADEDADTFHMEYKLKPLNRMAKRITIYFNEDDRALWASDALKGNPPRLGTDGPELPLPYAGMCAVDCSEASRSVIEHDYARSVESVRQDILNTLDGRNNHRRGLSIL